MVFKLNILKLFLSITILSAALNSVVYANPSESVSSVLDGFHTAASEANGVDYFELLTEESVFIGTDGSERWTKAQFKQFAMPYFSKGTGWTYIPRNRNIEFSPTGNVAWFDEMLDNQSYGECRGTGVLVLTDKGWRIAQYHLTIPIPNDLAKTFVAQIKASKGE